MQNSTGVEIGKSFRSGCSHSMCAHNKERITLIQRWKEEKLVGDSDRAYTSIFTIMDNNHSDGGGVQERRATKIAKTKKKPMKLVYISNPMKFKISASGFRALVQELTGQDSK
uniref:VQ domain-containing protein n=1 Tax=Salix viminalis TaxID=40686 RepID=A0A6N2KXV5_SALVM